MGTFIFIIGLLSLLVGLGLSVQLTRSEPEYADGPTKVNGFKLRFTRALAGAVAFVALTILSNFVTNSGFTTVDSGSVGVVKRFGNPVRQIEAGFHLLNPFGETVTPVTFQERVVKVSETAASHDLQTVTFQVTLRYHTDSNFATDILVRLNDDAENRVVIPAILESIKAITAKYDVKELVGQREVVKGEIETLVTGKMTPEHVIPNSVNITDFSFSKQYEDSIEAKVVAEQQAEQAKNVLTKVKIEAEQKIAAAEGEARALAAQKAQITPELLQLRMIEMLKEKWDGQLPQNYYGGSAPLPIVEALKGVKKGGSN